MAVQYRSHTNGRLFYCPDKFNDDTDRPTQLYRPRRSAPGRIVIRALGDRDAHRETVKARVSTHSPTSYLTRTSSVKLAVARENARRLLKKYSVGSQEQSGSTQQTHGKRRSWSPPKKAVLPIPEPPVGEIDSMRSHIRGSISGQMNSHLSRPRFHSDAATLSSSTSNDSSSMRSDLAMGDGSVVPNLDLQDEKPIASGNGVTMAIHLAEPVLFLQGFENHESVPGNTAMLRGSLHLRVTKSAKIKAVTLKFKGKAVTKWPEGIPPKKTEFEETDIIMSHTWPFFNAQFANAERGTNADYVNLFKSAEASVTRLDPLGRSSPNHSTSNLSSKDAKKLALSVNQSRSFGKGETPPGVPSVAAKGYRTFMPGDYIYNFELPIDSRLPETINVELGEVKYELEAEVTRSGAFRANLEGKKEITLIRAPGEGSLEQTEPIAISRNWEDQLHYDIVISGKSFPLGTQVPIAFKLTPLAKVQCHRIKVLVTENIEYFCSNKRVHRMEPTRKVQLFEKRADAAPQSTFPGSTMRVTAGGGIPYDARARAARGEDVTPNDTTNLLGSLDESQGAIGPTEMEFNVQLPSCHAMKERDRSQRLHFDTTYQNIQVHHWIKIVMRLSKPDATDPNKRRHFEISIDSPFHILSCRATQANISLPAYTSPQQGSGGTSLYECGCPGAARRRNSPTSSVPTINSLNLARTSLSNGNGEERPTTPRVESAGLARPQQAHVHGQAPAQRNDNRPIHLLRAPSFNPPAFEEEQPPPPLITPPPQYDSIASPTSGLADYFARLADTYDSDDDEGTSARGRVNVPLTPGGRIHRSMDIPRDRVPVGR